MRFPLNSDQTNAVKPRPGLGGDTARPPKSPWRYKGGTREEQGINTLATPEQHRSPPLEWRSSHAPRSAASRSGQDTLNEQRHPKATPEPHQSQLLGNRLGTQSHHKATTKPSQSHPKTTLKPPQGHLKAPDYAPAGAGVPALSPGDAGKPGGGGFGPERKLRHSLKGNMPRAIMNTWLPMKIISHLKAASMKP